MVRPRSFLCRLGWTAIGLTMDGMVYLYLTFDSFDHMLGAQREPAVNQHAAQPILRHAGFDGQQRFQLRVAILLHDEVDIVRVEERLNAIFERKTAQTHEIDG